MQCSAKASKGVLYAAFNQDSTCLSVATTAGFKIFNCETHKFVYEDPIGAVSIAEMLFCTSLVALVGAGEQAQLSPRRLSIVNSCTKETISNLNFSSTILAVKLNRCRLVIVLERKVHLHELNTLELMHTLDTAHNPKGMCALSPSHQHNYLVVPAASTAGSLLVFDCNSLHVLCEINAHQNPLVAMTISFDGTLVASASLNGTLIRVHSLPSASKTFTFRRGVSPAHVHSLSFGPPGCSPPLLAASSDKGTIHVFRLSHPPAPQGVIQSATSFAGGLLSRVMPAYLGLDDMVEPARSVVSVRLPVPQMPSIVALATESAYATSWSSTTTARQQEEESASRGAPAAAAPSQVPVPDKVRLIAVTADGLLHDWSLSGLNSAAVVSSSLDKEIPLQENASEAIGAVVHGAPGPGSPSGGGSPEAWSEPRAHGSPPLAGPEEGAGAELAPPGGRACGGGGSDDVGHESDPQESALTASTGGLGDYNPDEEMGDDGGDGGEGGGMQEPVGISGALAPPDLALRGLGDSQESFGNQSIRGDEPGSPSAEAGPPPPGPGAPGGGVGPEVWSEPCAELGSPLAGPVGGAGAALAPPPPEHLGGESHPAPEDPGLPPYLRADPVPDTEDEGEDEGEGGGVEAGQNPPPPPPPSHPQQPPWGKGLEESIGGIDLEDDET